MTNPQNYRVYKLNKSSGSLEQRGTAFRHSPEEAAQAQAESPGEYLVFDLNYTEVRKVAVRFVGTAI